jgi:hypothetical protein
MKNLICSKTERRLDFLQKRRGVFMPDLPHVCPLHKAYLVLGIQFWLDQPKVSRDLQREVYCSSNTRNIP